MSKKAAVLISIVALLPVFGAGALVWHVLHPTNANKQEVLGQTMTTTSTNDSSPSMLGVISSGAVPLGGLDSGSTTSQTPSGGGEASSPQSTFSGNSAKPSSNTSSASNSNTTSGNTATLDPAKFSQYDQYKNNSTALFADIKQGTGEEVTASTANKTLFVNYSGWLTNGQMFDQNTSADKPFSFLFGGHSVIPGWEQGISGMKVGGERLLIVPPSAGYGAAGQGPIPGNAVLVFDVKLLGIK